MKIDGVNNGIVLDHIKAGHSNLIYRLLKLDKLNCPVAMIQQVKSTKYGKKDIIKIDEDIPLNFDALGYLDTNITINRVKDGKLCEKMSLSLPEKLNDIIKCKNPRCITSIEQEIVHKFKLVDKENKVYRCVYCDSENKAESIED